MEIPYLLIQVIGFTGTILFFLSFQCKRNRRLFQVQFLSYLFYTIHLLLLGATTGAVSYLINLLRSACLGSRWEFAKSRYMCGLLCLLQIAALCFTWAGPLSILPVAANIASTLGGYTNNARKIRLAGMLINSPLWILYDVAVGSWAGIMDEVVSELSMLISIWRYGWKGLDGSGEEKG
ncbi:MAG: YgjV family protein [Lachnospiraceae bacterium]|nr:YgjV family protein [Lachnospiraceae bacterium]